MAKHPNKEIREAIQYAIDHGWMFKKSHGHSFGRLLCPTNSKCRNGIYCIFSVYSTPRNPYAHAKKIFQAVNGCMEKKQ